MFTVLLSNKAKKGLTTLEPGIHSRATELLRVLEQSPVPAKQYDLTKIAGREATYRVRLSRFRISYRVDWQSRHVNVLKIERRSETTYA